MAERTPSDECTSLVPKIDHYAAPIRRYIDHSVPGMSGYRCPCCGDLSAHCTCTARPTRQRRAPVEAPHPVARMLRSRWAEEQRQADERRWAVWVEWAIQAIEEIGYRIGGLDGGHVVNSVRGLRRLFAWLHLAARMIHERHGYTVAR